jgi:hypothetical protein
LSFSSNPLDLKESSVFIVTVPTPIDQFKAPDLTPLLKASEMLGKILKKGDIVIYESTVYPGCTEEDCVPVLEKNSGLKFNVDFFCGYSPERINPGDKVNTLTKIKNSIFVDEKLINELVKDMGNYTHNPYGFVRYAYSWGEGELTGEGASKPREWQKRILNKIGSHLSTSETRHSPLKIAVSSGHGIGKSALISWVCDWGMSTCEDCKIVVTANTENQLRTKTWPEITKWFNKSINSHWFKPTATAVASVDSSHEKNWRIDAVPWSENNTEAFAGLHNVKKRIILIFDEASSIADKVWEVAEGAHAHETIRTSSCIHQFAQMRCKGDDAFWV